jgi:hypothetical protein
MFSDAVVRLLGLAVEIDDAPIGAGSDHDIATEFVVVHHEHHMARHVAPEFDLPDVIVEVLLSAAPSVVEPAVCHPEDIARLPRLPRRDELAKTKKASLACEARSLPPVARRFFNSARVLLSLALPSRIVASARRRARSAVRVALNAACRFADADALRLARSAGRVILNGSPSCQVCRSGRIERRLQVRRR